MIYIYAIVYFLLPNRFFLIVIDRIIVFIYFYLKYLKPHIAILF